MTTLEHTETSEEQLSGVALLREHLGRPAQPEDRFTSPPAAEEVPAPAPDPAPEATWGPDPVPADLAPEPVRDPAAPDRRRVKILNTREIMDRPPVRWLVDGVFPEHGISLLYGPPGGGKSFFGLDLSLCVASGTQWHDHVTKRKLAITVAYEGVEGLKQRLEAWKLRNPLADTSWFGVIEEPLNILDSEDLDRLILTLAELPAPVGLLTLDTYARSMAGRGDENSAQDTGRYIAACDRIIRELDCHIQIVHHSNADGSRERGSTALRGAVDTAVLLRKEGDDDTKLTIVCNKQKDSAPFKTMSLRLEEKGNSCVIKRDRSGNRPPAVKPKTTWGTHDAPFQDRPW